MNLRYYTSAITLELDTTLCKGCGKCVEVCPHNVFEIIRTEPDDGIAAGTRTPRLCASIIGRDRCMECGACAMNCISGAIKAGKGVGCAAAIINGMIRGTEPSCDCGGGNGCSCS